MEQLRVVLATLAIIIVCGSASASDYVITKYGTATDTTRLSTTAVQKAIDKCSRDGGGRVVVPSGSFKIGSIFLRSNVCLWLDAGATLYGSTDIRDYKPVKPDYLSLRTHVETIQLIYAEGARNVSIDGYGTIDGRGVSFKKQILDGSDEGIARPHLLRMVKCENVSVRNVTLRNSACWMQHYLACDKVVIDGVKVFNRNNHNNDGLDLDGCHDAVVTNCIIDSDDDGIVLKSTSPRMCEGIIISNCIVSSHCNALKLGTESNGGFRNVSISNCIVKPSADQSTRYFGLERGISTISVEMVDGGVLEDVAVSNITAEGTESPIFVRLGRRNRPYASDIPVTSTGVLRRVRLSNITVTGAGATGCSVTGVPGMPVEDITLSDISISMQGGVSEDISLPPDEKAEGYPEATIWGKLPAKGFMVRHGRNVKFRNVEITARNSDVRPDYVYDDVE